jgi:transposase
MEQGEKTGARRGPRIRRTTAEKRRIVELTFEPRASVARVAQAEGVNANQVFKWRRAYVRGGLVETSERATGLLPVVVTGSGATAVRERKPEQPEQAAATTGAIHIELPGRAMISIESGADAAVVQAILESLRK